MASHRLRLQKYTIIYTYEYNKTVKLGVSVCMCMCVVKASLKLKLRAVSELKAGLETESKPRTSVKIVNGTGAEARVGLESIA
ncbi:hypothetical protein EVAR_63727_1 [Eumeta japonica]|uniref:Uncharacterized protein n=1 Tax=Eumeta variegata TaxID=151549 RepID=A0A4C1ZH44_EUMVA|nr:hypothetical protein EVAR_63727_1 [Eumeta japonica]